MKEGKEGGEEEITLQMVCLKPALMITLSFNRWCVSANNVLIRRRWVHAELYNAGCSRRAGVA